MMQGTQSRYPVAIWRGAVRKEVGGERGSGGRGHVYACGQFMLMYGKNIILKTSTLLQSNYPPLK